MASIIKNNLQLIAILAIYIIICFYTLDVLPGEWYGDISNLHEYVQDILAARFPWDFLQSTGPLYHYIVAPFAYVFGSTYYTYKVVSVGIAAVGLIFLWHLAFDFGGKRLAFASTSLAAGSFWYIVWGRLGTSP